MSVCKNRQDLDQPVKQERFRSACASDLNWRSTCGINTNIDTTDLGERGTSLN